MDKVLVVDDDEIVLRLMDKALEYADIAATTTTDPQAALQHLQDSAFEILLTDLCMDGMDGIALFHRARACQPMLRGICFSAHVDDAALQRINGAGFDDCLHKPVRRDALVAAIRRCLAIRTHWLELQRVLDPA